MSGAFADKAFSYLTLVQLSKKLSVIFLKILPQSMFRASFLVFSCFCQIIEVYLGKKK